MYEGRKAFTAATNHFAVSVNDQQNAKRMRTSTHTAKYHHKSATYKGLKGSLLRQLRLHIHSTPLMKLKVIVHYPDSSTPGATAEFKYTQAVGEGNQTIKWLSLAVRARFAQVRPREAAWFRAKRRLATPNARALAVDAGGHAQVPRTGSEQNRPLCTSCGALTRHMEDEGAAGAVHAAR